MAISTQEALRGHAYRLSCLMRKPEWESPDWNEKMAKEWKAIADLWLTRKDEMGTPIYHNQCCTMRDDEFLKWLHSRLHQVHGESPNVDYMQRLLQIADEVGKMLGDHLR